MKPRNLLLSVAALVTGCTYSHVASTVATFQPPANGSALELRITRHLDTVVHGPDDEEDQLLVLEVRDFQLNQRLRVPSENVTPTFLVTRFGPRSNGETYRGIVIVRKVGEDKVEATVKVDVEARTESGTYKQTAKFHGHYIFWRRPAAEP